MPLQNISELSALVCSEDNYCDDARTVQWDIIEIYDNVSLSCCRKASTCIEHRFKDDSVNNVRADQYMLLNVFGVWYKVQNKCREDF